VALAALGLGACAFGVNERYFFVPKPAATIVTDPAQIQIVDEERITGPVSLEGRPVALAGRLPRRSRKKSITSQGGPADGPGLCSRRQRKAG